MTTLHIIPGVRQDASGALYRIGFESDGTQVQVPYSASWTYRVEGFDRVVRIEADGSEKRI